MLEVKRHTMACQKIVLAATLLWTVLLNASCYGDSTSKPASTGCPEGYRPFKNKCYKIYTNNIDGVQPLNYDQAKSFCQKEGAYLTIIHSKEEQDFLTAYLGEPSVNNMAWIGLKKDSNENPQWIDGSDIKSFSNFAPLEPNGGSRQQCFQFESDEFIAGMWDDIKCSAGRGYICQTNQVAGSRDASFQQDTRCPEGFSYYKDACFKLEQTETDFWSAESKCENDYGGHLASIRDNYEEAFVATLTVGMGEHIWIGFSDHINDLIKGKFTWTDGNYIYHLNWKQGEPAEASDASDRCAAITPNGWIAKDCNEKLRFVCSKRLTRNDRTETHVGTCPEGWIDVHNPYCYYLETEHNAPYLTAMANCARLAPNATLAMFETAHDLMLLRPALSKHYRKVDRQFKAPVFTVGIKQIRRGSSVFEFSNGKPATYLPWGAYEPNNLGTEACVELTLQLWNYNNVPCHNSRFYICQTDKVGQNILQKEVMTHRVSEKKEIRVSEKKEIRVSEKKEHRVSENNDHGPTHETTALIGVGVTLVALGLFLSVLFFYRKKRLSNIKPDERIFRFQNEDE